MEALKSLYIHIPFCVQKCLYCDFNSYSGKEELIDKYVESLKKELNSYGVKNFKTIYFGGGTPSILPATKIEEIMNEVSCTGEVTLELNPGTIDVEKLKIYKKAGINRLSIGLQTTQDNILREIGRIHNLEDFENAFKMARAVGFDNISVDLMFGLPTQTIENLEDSINFLIEMKPEHVSCYSLILHAPIFKNLPSEEDERKMYDITINKLKKAGYIQYEISNFAKKGYESRHNLCYWNQAEYIGIGAGASSYVDGKRYTNETSIEKYIEKINNNEQVFEIEEIQDEGAKLREYIILKLRLTDGVSIEKVKNKFDVNIEEKFVKEIDKMEKLELLEKLNVAGEERLRLTRKGFDFANLVWSEFL